MIPTEDEIKVAAEKYAADKNEGWYPEYQTYETDEKGFKAGAAYVMQQLLNKHDVGGRSEQLPLTDDELYKKAMTYSLELNEDMDSRAGVRLGYIAGYFDAQSNAGYGNCH